MKFTGADLLIKILHERLNVETIFGYPGGAILPIYDALFRYGKIRHILTRHEQAAGHSAEGYARSTGKVGVLFATSGPGATNTVTALTDALMDAVPLVCITGQVPTSLIGTDAFQEADVIGITRSCTKNNYLIRNVTDIPHILEEAFFVAKSGKPGPVLIDIPKDIQNEICSDQIPVYKIRKSILEKMEKSSELDFYPDVQKAISILKEAKKPIIYIGGGLINSGDAACDLLVKFVEKTGFPITSTLMGLGAIDTSHKQFLKMLGMHGSLEANLAMHDCDAMICIGARFDDRVTGSTKHFSPNSKKIHIDIDNASINKIIKVDVGIKSDAQTILQLLLENWDLNKTQQEDISLWWNEIEGWREQKSFSYTQKQDEIIAQFAIDSLSNLLYKTQKDIIISTDVGQHQMWAAQFCRFTKPRKWLTSGGLGTMGYGLPAAIGAQIANPESICICISGDASVLMNIQELSTIKQYKLPVKLFIVNNSYMGMVKQWQDLFYENRHSNSYTDSLPDFEVLASAYNIKGITCKDPSELEEKINQMIQHDGPVVFNCLVSKDQHVFPMMPVGAAHNNIIMGK